MYNKFQAQKLKDQTFNKMEVHLKAATAFSDKSIAFNFPLLKTEAASEQKTAENNFVKAGRASRKSLDHRTKTASTCISTQTSSLVPTLEPSS